MHPRLTCVRNLVPFTQDACGSIHGYQAHVLRIIHMCIYICMTSSSLGDFPFSVAPTSKYYSTQKRKLATIRN